MTWDEKFIAVAELVRTWSKDPSTKVGCVIVDDDHNILAEGYNGFPRKINDNSRLKDRQTKLKMIVHAEANAVAAAARNEKPGLKGSTAYITMPPCPQCAALLIQSGIKLIVFPDQKIPERWKSDILFALDLLSEAGVDYINKKPGQHTSGGVQ